VFSGLATSTDGGRIFRRCSTVPILERTNDEHCFRVIHSILNEHGIWRAWYGGGSTWIEENGRTLPSYDIRYIESPDGLRFPQVGRVCIPLEAGEVRVGRPYVLRRADRYEMYFAAQRRNSSYRLAFATSVDGLEWTRCERGLDIRPTEGAWDSDMMSFPAVVTAHGRTYLFYNGNAMGAEGFGLAIGES
jgi:hypothetical protein